MRIFKPLICLVLCISLVLSFVSCQYIDPIIDKITGERDNNDVNKKDPAVKESTHTHEIVPKGYTGGAAFDPCFHAEKGVYWLETYEEVLEAIELLKSHGSTVSRSIAFDCEGDLLDVKYCFLYSKSKAEPLEEGKNFFDRKIDGGEFQWYAFYEDVAIEDFMYYNLVIDYDVMRIKYVGDTWLYRDFENVEDTSNLSISWWGKGHYDDCEEEPLPEAESYYIMHNDYTYAELEYSETLLPKDYYDEFLSTFVIIE